MEVTTKPARVTSRWATDPAARHDGRGTSWARRGIPRRDVQAFVDAQRAGRALRRRASASPSGEDLPVGLRLGRQRHRRAAGIAGKAGARTTDPADVTGNDARGFGAFHRHLNPVEVGVRGKRRRRRSDWRRLHLRGCGTRIRKRPFRRCTGLRRRGLGNPPCCVGRPLHIRSSGTRIRKRPLRRCIGSRKRSPRKRYCPTLTATANQDTQHERHDDPPLPHRRSRARSDPSRHP
jgi:hypothetical protein